MPEVHGLLETALYVANVRKAADFYRRLFRFETLLESERLIALDVVGRNVLLLFLKGATVEPYTTPGGVIPGHSASGRSHLAFSIEAQEIEAWRQRLQSEGIAVESEVSWDGGAHSLYFRDPDEHLVELITRGFWRTY
jgi:catechol 2,3-dioxygenase-like lactoylglutathione lyase family enzyme